MDGPELVRAVPRRCARGFWRRRLSPEDQ